jgi:hypothetical protein
VKRLASLTRNPLFIKEYRHWEVPGFKRYFRCLTTFVLRGLGEFVQEDPGKIMKLLLSCASPRSPLRPPAAAHGGFKSLASKSGSTTFGVSISVVETVVGRSCGSHLLLVMYEGLPVSLGSYVVALVSGCNGLTLSHFHD